MRGKGGCHLVPTTWWPVRWRLGGSETDFGPSAILGTQETPKTQAHLVSNLPPLNCTQHVFWLKPTSHRGLRVPHPPPNLSCELPHSPSTRSNVLASYRLWKSPLPGRGKPPFSVTWVLQHIPYHIRILSLDTTSSHWRRSSSRAGTLPY